MSERIPDDQSNRPTEPKDPKNDMNDRLVQYTYMEPNGRVHNPKTPAQIIEEVMKKYRGEI